MSKVGKNWHLYYNSGSFKDTLSDYTTPTWVEFDEAQDITFSAPKDVVELLRRAAKVKEIETIFAEVSINLSMNYRKGSAVLAAIESHFWNADDGDWMHIALVDGPIATSGSKGFQMPAKMVDFGFGAPIAGRTDVPLVFRPAYEQSASTFKEFETLVVA